MNGFMQALFFVLGIVLMILGLGAAQYGLVLYGDRSVAAMLQANSSPTEKTSYSHTFPSSHCSVQYAFSSLDYYCCCARQEKITDTAGRLLSSVQQANA